MESKAEKQKIQSMMVFYVLEGIGSGRMGNENAWIFAFDGNMAYISSDSVDAHIPKTFEEVEDFLKDNYFVVTKRENSLPIVDTIVRCGKGKSISDYKYGDEAYLGGMGHFGYSLGVIDVKVMEEECKW